MTRHLLISVAPGEIRAGLVEGGRVVELHIERETKPTLLNAIFLGRVQRIAPALGGAFIDIGAQGLSAYFPRMKQPSGENLVEGQSLIVQVTKDAFGDKPPEVTAALALSGSLVTFTPQRKGVAVSRQLPGDEQVRLAEILSSLLTDSEGAIARSRATGASRAAIEAEIAALRVRYAALRDDATRGRGPRRLGGKYDALRQILESIDPAPDRILVDDRAAFASLRSSAPPVVLDTNMGFLDDAFASACASSVTLRGGANLVIEETAGFAVVDVNLGMAGGRAAASSAIREVNLDAARELAAQLRLRRIGGAVVIDFISMEGRTEREIVAAELARHVAGDPVQVQLLGWTRLGHYELTRKRQGPSVAGIMLEKYGRKTAGTVALEALRAVAKAPFQPGPAILRVSPPVAVQLNGQFAALLADAIASAGRSIHIMADSGRDNEAFELTNG